jgi:hypothetical protein
MLHKISKRDESECTENVQVHLYILRYNNQSPESIN